MGICFKMGGLKGKVGVNHVGAFWYQIFLSTTEKHLKYGVCTSFIVCNFPLDFIFHFSLQHIIYLNYVIVGC